MTRTYDPTDEPRGYTRMRAKTRHLRRFDHTNQSAKSAVALSPCEVVAADGTRHTFVKRRNHVTHEVYIPSTVVKIRHRTLRGPITDYIDVAERVGLNAQSVAAEYRYRRDNGYTLPTEVKIETNATFRGGDA